MTTKNELEKIKDEILSEISPSKKKKNSINWGSKSITAIVVVLVVISVFQVFQSASILNKVKSGSIKPVNASSESLPSNLQNLPNMVGGC